jgi:cytochrome P450
METWGTDPEAFRPERFIGSDGKIANADKIIPFSLGIMPD